MSKEIHIWIRAPLGYANIDCSYGYYDTIQRLKYDEVINTTVLNFCNSKYYECGYRIIVHLPNGNRFEFQPGKQFPTGREIKIEQNWMNLLLAGECGSLS